VIARDRSDVPDLLNDAQDLLGGPGCPEAGEPVRPLGPQAVDGSALSLVTEGGGGRAIQQEATITRSKIGRATWASRA
jgi:hypothetical protein